MIEGDVTLNAQTLPILWPCPWGGWHAAGFLQQWKKAQVNKGVRCSYYHPGLGGEGSGSPIRSYVVTLWDESQEAQVHGDLVIQLQEPLFALPPAT